ncbi:MAG: S-adenosylmethionine:tRNA ribosyltransferase-isomerase, partial [Anaerolineae bacterium]|nr:S-adenosylmethionine:tRNA ribosyltransferase-isomerase [Anaerolineae bacterium]
MFERPSHLQATAPAEARGRSRDQARLLVSTPQGHQHAIFRDLPALLEPGDLLVVNDSATLPASLPASSGGLSFIVHFSTDYGGGIWLIEPRWSAAQPGPLPLNSGDALAMPGLTGRLISRFPGLDRLWFVRFDGDVQTAMTRFGAPIRYGYVSQRYPLTAYQTAFARNPGSAEMPSAAYPFTPDVVRRLRERGVGVTAITLHTGVSSLEVEHETVEDHPLFPEPFAVSRRAADAVNAAHREGRRVIAVGTTAIRALESAWNGSQVVPRAGFTRVYVHPGAGIHTVNGLITGLHDPVTS